MRRLRPLVTVAAVFLLVAAAGVSVLRWTVFRDLRRLAEERLSGTLGTPVSVGDVTLGWGGVVLRDIKVDASNRTCVAVDRISVGVAWDELLQRRVRLTAVKIAGGRVIFVAGGTNLLPFYRERLARLRGGGGSSLPFAVSFSGVRIERLALVWGPVEDFVEVLDLRPVEAGLVVKLSGVLRGILEVQAEGVWAATNRGEVVYRPRIASWKRWFSEGRLVFVADGLSDVRGINTTRGSDRLLRFGFEADLTKGDIVVPPSVSNVLRVPSGEAKVEATMRGFDTWKVRAAGSVKDLSAFLPSWEGGALFSAVLEGALRRGRRWHVKEATLTSERLEIAGILSNRLEVRDALLQVNNHQVVKGQANLRSGGTALAVRFRTGQLSDRPLRVRLEGSGDLVDFRDLRRPVREPGSARAGVPILVEADISARRVRTGKWEAEGVTVSLRNNEGGVWSGRVRGGYAGGTVVGDILFRSGTVEWTGRIDGLDLGRVVSGVDGSLSGQGQGRWSAAAGVAGRAEVLSGGLVWRGVEFSGLSGVVSVTGSRVWVQDAAASFHGGSAKGWAQYDWSVRTGEFGVSAEGVRTESLYPVLVKDEPNARFSGRASLEARGRLKAGESEVKGRLALGKGVVRDTRYQKEFDRILSTDAFNDLLYDEVRAEFAVSSDAVEVAPLVVVAPEFEVEMALKRPRGGAGRAVVDLYLTDDFLNRLPNVMKVPVAVVSRKDRKWTWVRLEESGGAVRAVKPPR